MESLEKIKSVDFEVGFEAQEEDDIVSRRCDVGPSATIAEEDEEITVLSVEHVDLQDNQNTKVLGVLN